MAGPSRILALKTDLAELPRLAAFVDAFCAPLAATPADTIALKVALEELATNVITHGYAAGAARVFTVALEAADGRVTAVVDDDAPAYDPLARPEVDTSLPLERRPIGGLGVHLVKKTVENVRYERRGGRNILTFQRTLGR